MIGADAEKPEGQRRIEAFFIGPFRRCKAVGHVFDRNAERPGDAAEERSRARVVDAFAHVEHRRQVVGLKPPLQGIAAVIPGRVRRLGVAKLDQRIRRAAVGENQVVVFEHHVGVVHNGLFVDDPRVRAAHEVDNAPDGAVLERIYQHVQTAEGLFEVFHREANIRRDFVGRNGHRHILAVFEAFDGAVYDLFGDLLRFADVGVVVVVADVFSPGETAGIVGRHDRGFEAPGHVHDRRVHFLHVGHPQVQGPGGDDHFRADRVGQRNDPVVAVHGRQAAAADAVELDALGAGRLRLVDELLGLARPDDFPHQHRQVAVDRDVDVILLQCADVDLRRCPVANAEEPVCDDGRPEHRAEGEGEAVAEHLLHDTLPVAVDPDPGDVIGFKSFVIGAHRDDVQVPPDFLAFRRCAGGDGFVLARIWRRQIVKQHLAQVDGDVLELTVLRLDPKLFGHRADLVFPFDGHVELAFSCPHQIENDFPFVHAVLGHSGGGHPAEVPGDDEVSVSAADPLGAFRGDPARAHLAVLAADPRDAETALGLLGVKAVEDVVDAQIVHPAHQFPDGRVRRFFHLLLFIREGLFIRGDRLHVVVLIVRVRRVIVFVVDHLRNAVFVKADDRPVAVIPRRVFMAF